MAISSISLKGLAASGTVGTASIASFVVYPSSSSGSTGLAFSDNNALKGFSGGVCVNSLLSQGQKDLLKKPNISENKGKELGDKFKNAQGESKGCLALSWDKQIGNEDYWKGKIRYEWLFTKGDEAIVIDGFYDSTYLESDPEDEHQKQNDNDNNGKATYINTKSQKKGGLMWQKSKNIQDQILKKPRLLDGSWSFDSNYLCQTEKCKGSAQKNEGHEAKGRWDKSKENQGQTFDHWHEKFIEIFGFPFNGANKTLESLKNLVKSEKGSWKNL